MATKHEREECWKGRDAYFDCLKANNDDPKTCGQQRKLFESSCSTAWVKYFERKHSLQKYKDENEAKNYQILASAEEDRKAN